tara:strand:- start:1104 stop:2057 length:954 start_codon:yes stop_codon:yes gene_type:complete
MSNTSTFFGGGVSYEPRIEKNEEDIANIVIPNPNLLINGDFSVWQRGVTGNHTGTVFAMTADRWFAYVGSGTVTAGLGYGYEAGSQRLGYYLGSTGGATDVQIGQRIESTTLASYAGVDTKSLTFSIWAWSSTGTNSIDVHLHAPTAPDNYAGTDLKVVETLGTPKENTWSKFEVTMPWHDAFRDGLQIALVVQGTLQQDLTFSRAKLEIGDKATPFIADDPQTNMAKCQRYYWKDALNPRYAHPLGDIAQYWSIQLDWTEEMRTTPTLSYGYSGFLTAVDVQVTDIYPSGFYLQFGSNTTGDYGGVTGLTADAELY